MKTLQQTCQIINTKNSKLFGALFIMLFIQSCMKEEYDKVEHKTNYYYLTAAQLNQTPYFTNPTFDTISFASNKGDTLTFVKTKTDTTWYCENGSGNPNTGYDKDCYQTIHNTYATVKGNGSFDVKHKKADYNVIRDQLEIRFNEFVFYVYDDRIGTSIGSTIGSTYFETILLNNITYNKVKILYNNYNEKLNYCYLNKESGLISIVDGNINLKYYKINN